MGDKKVRYKRDICKKHVIPTCYLLNLTQAWGDLDLHCLFPTFPFGCPSNKHT